MQANLTQSLMAARRDVAVLLQQLEDTEKQAETGLKNASQAEQLLERSRARASHLDVQVSINVPWIPTMYPRCLSFLRMQVQLDHRHDLCGSAFPPSCGDCLAAVRCTDSVMALHLVQ